jgi:hypothetical protein
MSSGESMVDLDGLSTVIGPYVGRQKQLGLSTRRYHDLHIGGDDAEELFAEIVKQFGTSLAGINFRVIFPGEHEMGIRSLLLHLGIPDRKHRPLTVGHLLAVINRGEWFGPPPVGECLP